MTRLIARFLCFGILLVGSLHAQITFDFDYVDVNSDTNAGFDDPTYGAARQSSLAAGAQLLANYFTTAAPRTVRITVNQSLNNSSSGTLASAGGFSTTNDGYNVTVPMAVIQSGAYSGSSSHGSMTWNFGKTWDLDDDIDPGAFDFKRVTMHELAHVLGFSSFIGESGEGQLAGTDGEGQPVSFPKAYSYFDQFLTDSLGNQLVDSDGNFNGGMILGDGVSGDVFFNGANAVAAYGGLVPMYSPSSYVEGSSLSHLDTTVFGTTDYVMTHAVSAGASQREFSALELAMWQDLGYTLSAVPEPAAAAVWFGGVVLIFAVTRRRRARVAA